MFVEFELTPLLLLIVAEIKTKKINRHKFCKILLHTILIIRLSYNRRLLITEYIILNYMGGLFHKNMIQ
jgi:hypothetical protein